MPVHFKRSCSSDCLPCTFFKGLRWPRVTETERERERERESSATGLVTALGWYIGASGC